MWLKTGLRPLPVDCSDFINKRCFAALRMIKRYVILKKGVTKDRNIGGIE